VGQVRRKRNPSINEMMTDYAFGSNLPYGLAVQKS
jgi:hypothetical protein